jgi:hypothetical protein
VSFDPKQKVCNYGELGSKPYALECPSGDYHLHLCRPAEGSYAGLHDNMVDFETSPQCQNNRVVKIPRSLEFGTFKTRVPDDVIPAYTWCTLVLS